MVKFNFEIKSAIESVAYSKLGLARLFAEVTKDNLIYVDDAKKFFFYNGKKWQLDSSKIIHERELVRFAEYLLNQLRELTLYENDKQTTKDKIQLQSYAESLFNPGTWSSFLKAYRLYNFTQLSEFDKDGTESKDFGLFNCANGTLDLNTLNFRSHYPSDRLTMCSDVVYNETLKCDRWDVFIDEITCGNTELSGYIQKVFGYSLSAITLHEEMYMLFGKKSRNGKSTLVNAILSVLGIDYGKNMTAASISKRASVDGSKASSDLARHSNSRLVNISEPQQGMSMDALVKIITGQDKIVARYLFKEFFEYTAKFKLFITTNHLPIITDSTLFASDRIVVIPFDNFFGDSPDTGLKDLFHEPENQSAILNWLLEGLKMYKKEGLERPSIVNDAIEEYRCSLDTEGLFFKERVEECENTIKTKRKVFYDEYVDWCGENAYDPLSIGKFNVQLKQKLNVKKINAGNKGVEDGGFYVIGYRIKQN